MPSRREILAGVAAAAGIAASPAKAGAASSAIDPCSLVDPFIGTGGHGHTYPGASLPFGMVQLSPDTNNQTWDASSGYHHDDPTIMGFSHTHLSGTGVGDMLDVLVVPATGVVRLDPGASQRPEAGYHSRYDRTPQGLTPGRLDLSALGYRSRFDHADEKASPGYYRVRLKDSGVEAELTATMRAGLHRYRFPTEAPAHLLIDFSHGSREGDRDRSRVSEALLEWRDGMLVGGRRVHQWADGRQIYFALEVSQAPRAVRLYSNDQPLDPDAVRAEGAQLKCVLDYGDTLSGPLLVRVGISGVDVEGAIRNLRAELPGWDFDGTHAAARRAWQEELSRAVISGGDEADRQIFYTALYHTLLAPTLFSDFDGRYRGMDTAIHRLPDGEANFSTYSLWDTYRALSPLFTLMHPKRAGQMAQGLVRMAAESPAGPPIWPLQGIETFCMNGWHSAVVLAEAAAKRLPGVDLARAWPIYRRRAFEDRFGDLPSYRALGYLPCDRVAESVSKTLEYAYDDWAMARLAEAAGAQEDAGALRRRSRNYHNLFDPKTGYMRPKLANGQWAEPFDPREVSHGADWLDFTESDAWQATFVPQHDLHAYIEAFGGAKAFEARLDEFFTTSPDIGAGAPPDIAGLVGQYAHGNEPCHHIAYLYAYAGAHHKTQACVRMLLRSMYRAEPDGLPGNEDCGQMSAWYVLSALGLYPVDPVSGIYVFGAPLFERAELQIGDGRRLIVEAPGNGPATPFVQSVQWNGRPHSHAWIAHSALIEGGRLSFHMGAQPNRAFGAAMADRPPSAV